MPKTVGASALEQWDINCDNVFRVSVSPTEEKSFYDINCYLSAYMHGEVFILKTPVGKANAAAFA
ncbi:MAG: hypothetical protein K2G51_12655 [Lachnospiraceae bacterium]|nr:hypothetical protein [Lachnospiraceae bacterium]MDE7274819.1 hypothetical protein [Lachnospiraceae bacterium]